MSAGPRWIFPSTPSLIVGHVGHARRGSVAHAFRTSHYQWLVDLDALPSFGGPLRLISRFSTRDHLASGATDGTIKGDLVALLQREGISVETTDRLLMLAHARCFGYAFDPLSVFWCVDAEGNVKATVLEVHNTYGGRHSYVIDPDSEGRAKVAKQFLVSPFNDTRGSYDVQVEIDRERLRIDIALTRRGEQFFSASLSGDALPATRRSLLRIAARHPLITQKVALFIRVHGIRLWLAGLPVQRRAAPTGKEKTT